MFFEEISKLSDVEIDFDLVMSLPYIQPIKFKQSGSYNDICGPMRFELRLLERYIGWMDGYPITKPVICNFVTNICRVFC